MHGALLLPDSFLATGSLRRCGSFAWHDSFTSSDSLQFSGSLIFSGSFTIDGSLHGGDSFLLIGSTRSVFMILSHAMVLFL